MLLLCLVVVMNNLVTLSSARQLKNSANEKEEVIGKSEITNGGGDQVDPSKNNNNKAKMELDDLHPFPFPFPQFSPVPVQDGLPFPFPRFPFPSFPPIDIPGVPPYLPVPSPPI